MRELLLVIQQRRDLQRTEVKLRQPCRKVLTSLAKHWSGLTLFLDDPRIPLDNNYGERLMRNPAVGRKNYYGSGAEWAGRLATIMFSLVATLALANLNPRLWLNWYLQACADAGGQPPLEIECFLPWNLSDDQRARLTHPTKAQPHPDSS